MCVELSSSLSFCQMSPPSGRGSLPLVRRLSAGQCLLPLFGMRQAGVEPAQGVMGLYGNASLLPLRRRRATRHASPCCCCCLFYASAAPRFSLNKTTKPFLLVFVCLSFPGTSPREGRRMPTAGLAPAVSCARPRSLPPGRARRDVDLAGNTGGAVMKKPCRSPAWCGGSGWPVARVPLLGCAVGEQCANCCGRNLCGLRAPQGFFLVLCPNRWLVAKPNYPMKPDCCSGAPRGGVEPPTPRLTIARSAIELPRIYVLSPRFQTRAAAQGSTMKGCVLCCGRSQALNIPFSCRLRAS